MLRIYGIKNCDSVRKALKFLNVHNAPYEFVDFKTDPVGCDTVKRWLEHVDMARLFNTRGTTYRTLGLKSMNLDDAQKAEWLCRENMLIKRPVIEYDGNVIVGYDPQHYEGVFQ